ncbi:hypothetical protein RHD99_15900 [Buttiauxella selenatireducens]|uniref:DUF3060 domain-containing protein n=1 Tax=Buttiauxella selenatireducens TaxID=3073902 RepID=A0ABY9S5Y8_9ENTR|nr:MULTISPECIES: hypothetical protein [unclassified Buttiauxella]WMY72944.1 hypothetical protein RHD99_15900 [Buttiauxella sp. R73]GDX08054.1 hypothetical protein BSPA111_42810 [Buttiauxella sp. A111]
MKFRKATVILLGLSLFSGICGANSSQVVIVKGSVYSEANQGGVALTNIGSVLGNGKQNVTVDGVSQTVSIGGSVVNVSKGKGSKSEINVSSINNR